MAKKDRRIPLKKFQEGKLGSGLYFLWKVATKIKF